MDQSGMLWGRIKVFFFEGKKRMGSAADKNFLDLILPQGILEYFSLTDFTGSIGNVVEVDKSFLL